MSLNVSSSGSSSENASGADHNAKPTINLNLLKKRRNTGFNLPEGIHADEENRNTLESRYWGNAPFFINAKPAAMLERGWIRSNKLKKGTEGLLTIKDGPELLVKVVEGLHGNLLTGKQVFTVLELGRSSREPFDLPVDNWHEEWDFYISTKKVPFVPKASRGGSKKRTIHKSKRSRGRTMRRKA
jgi:hypothetical protein